MQEVPKSTPRVTPSTGRFRRTHQAAKGLFHGRGIQLMNLSKKGSVIDNLRKFVKFCWDPAYREKVRDDFLEVLKSDIRKSGPLGTEEEEINNIETRINDIMKISDIDLPENKRMELILFVANQGCPDIINRIDMGDTSLPLSIRTNYNAASSYFQDQQTTIRNKIIEIALSEDTSLNQQLTFLYNIPLNIISSQQELNSVKTTYCRLVIDKLKDNLVPFKKTEEYVQKLIDDSELNLSEKEGLALSIYACAKYEDHAAMKALLEKVVKSDISEGDKIELIENAVGNDSFKDIKINILGKNTTIKPLDYYQEKTMASIDRMAMATALPKNQEATEAILKNIKIEGLDNEQIKSFGDFQKAYAEAVIKGMVAIYRENEKALTTLEENVAELVKFDSAIVLSKTQKRDLIKQVKNIAESEQDATLVAQALAEKQVTANNRRFKIAEMRKETMDLLEFAKEHIVGSNLADGLIGECDKIAEGGDGNLNEVKSKFKDIQSRCVRRCIQAIQKYAFADAYYWAQKISQAATLLSEDEKKQLSDIIANARASVVKIYTKKINEINKQITAEMRIPKAKRETLNQLYSKYLEGEVDPLKAGDLIVSYLKELISELTEIEIRTLLKQNIEKILTDPNFQFSKEQLKTIRIDLANLDKKTP